MELAASNTATDTIAPAREIGHGPPPVTRTVSSHTSFQSVTTLGWATPTPVTPTAQVATAPMTCRYFLSMALVISSVNLNVAGVQRPREGRRTTERIVLIKAWSIHVDNRERERVNASSRCAISRRYQ
jgi:hypothetical protein